jgi:hypothetical protein
MNRMERALAVKEHCDTLSKRIKEFSKQRAALRDKRSQLYNGYFRLQQRDAYNKLKQLKDNKDEIDQIVATDREQRNALSDPSSIAQRNAYYDIISTIKTINAEICSLRHNKEQAVYNMLSEFKNEYVDGLFEYADVKDNNRLSVVKTNLLSVPRIVRKLFVTLEDQTVPGDYNITEIQYNWNGDDIVYKYAWRSLSEQETPDIITIDPPPTDEPAHWVLNMILSQGYDAPYTYTMRDMLKAN